MNLKALFFTACLFASSLSFASEALPVQWFGNIFTDENGQGFIRMNYGKEAEAQTKTITDFTRLLSVTFNADRISDFERQTAQQPRSYMRPRLPIVKTCQDIFQIEDAAIFNYVTGYFLYSQMSSDCYTIKIISEMKSSEISYLRDFRFTKKVISELPVEFGKGLTYAPFFSDVKKKNFKNFGEMATALAKTWKRKPKYSEGLFETGENDSIYVSFDIVALGDYDGDGIEDALVRVVDEDTPGARGEGGGFNNHSSLYVITKRHTEDKIVVLKPIIQYGYPVIQIKFDSVLEDQEHFKKTGKPEPNPNYP